MSKKYLTADSQSTLRLSSVRVVTNDLYLAAFLHCVGCPLDHLERNDRRRLSFVFIGERVRELREAYRTGPVKLDMRSFRESLLYIRRLMDLPAPSLRQAGDEPEQRSVSHDHDRAMQAVAQC
jgi:hypothetical protein